MSTDIRRNIDVLLLLASISAMAGSACAEISSSGASAVKELGRLNGISLACAQPALTARAREILVGIAPKEREVGEAYERATQDAFLAQGKEVLPCPQGKALAIQIDAAESALRQAFPRTP